MYHRVSGIRLSQEGHPLRKLEEDQILFSSGIYKECLTVGNHGSPMVVSLALELSHNPLVTAYILHHPFVGGSCEVWLVVLWKTDKLKPVFHCVLFPRHVTTALHLGHYSWCLFLHESPMVVFYSKYHCSVEWDEVIIFSPNLTKPPWEVGILFPVLGPFSRQPHDLIQHQLANYPSVVCQLSSFPFFLSIFFPTQRFSILLCLFLKNALPYLP